MQLLKSPSLRLDQLWNGVGPVVQSPLALAALKLIRRNPKTMIALGIAGAGGVLLAALLARSGKKADAEKRHRARRNGSAASYAARAAEPAGSAAMTQ
jgi:hypothetical protein